MGRCATCVGFCPWPPPRAKQGFHRIVVPTADAAEAALIPDLEIIPVDSLSGAVQVPDRPGGPAPPFHLPPADTAVPDVITDFREIKGQEHVKRALEVAAAGGHNVIMVGPPGAGKTLLARALPGILPRMSIDEALDVTRIYSVADQLPPGVPLIRARPFRAPHHTISHAGTGRRRQPGRIRAKFRLRTAACSSWTSCPSSARACSR